MRWLTKNRTPIGVAVAGMLIASVVLAAAGAFGDLVAGDQDSASDVSNRPTASPPLTRTATPETAVTPPPATEATQSQPCLENPRAGEPNDTLADAAGPLRASIPYRGQIDTYNDEDWYAFCVASRAQISATLTVSSDARVGATLQDESGDSLAEASASLTGSGVLSYTVEPGRYFIRLKDYCCDEKGRWGLQVRSSVPLSAHLPAG